MLETAERLTAEEREPAVQQYLLLVGGLRALAEGVHEPGLVLDAFLLRSLVGRGYAPSFDALRPLRRRRGRTARSRSPGGGAVCPRLPAARQSASPAPETLRAARRAAQRRLGDAPTPATPGTAARAAAWSSAYLQWHLERGLRSLPLVDAAERARSAG